jgi:cobalt-zinc-cadmium efflux system outer membrane protein
MLSFAAPIAKRPSDPPSVKQVSWQDDDLKLHQVKPETVGLIPLTVEEPQTKTEIAIPNFEERGFGNAVSLSQLEQLLLSAHPEILKTESRILALTGKELQAGLPPNPTVGIAAEDINANDGAGRYGVYFGRQIVRGGKLALAQNVVRSEIEVAQNQLNATRQRLLIDLRRRYYNALLAEETVSQTLELVEVLQRSVDTSEKLFEAEEIAKAPVLRSQVELQNALMMVRQARNQRTAAFRRLAALIGEPDVSFEVLAGDVHDLPMMNDFEMAFDQMLEVHPELSAAFTDIERARRELSRQKAVPIPNLTWQTTMLYDFTTDEMVGAFQIGMPLPKCNRNEGAVYQAEQNIQTSIHAADQKALELRDRLTNSWANYVDAKIQLETMDLELLPKAQEAMDLASEGYRQGETPYLELLLAQQLYMKTKLGYLQKLRQRWQYQVEIEGLISDFSTGCP